MAQGVRQMSRPFSLRDPDHPFVPGCLPTVADCLRLRLRQTATPPALRAGGTVVPEAPLRGQGLALVVRRRRSPRFPAVAGADGSSLLPPQAPSPRRPHLLPSQRHLVPVKGLLPETPYIVPQCRWSQNIVPFRLKPCSSSAPCRRRRIPGCGASSSGQHSCNCWGMLTTWWSTSTRR